MAASKNNPVKFYLSVTLCIYLLLGSIQISAQTIDKKLDATLKKCSVMVESKSYYKLYKFSKTALKTYPNEKYLHYSYAFALYNDRNNAKILKEVPNETAFWKEIHLHLEKSKPLPDFDNGFSADLQKEFYKMSNKELGDGKFEHAQKIYKFWFEFFDNSDKVYNNKYDVKVQDTLFGYGKKHFYANNEVKADQAFNYMFKTFYRSKFEYVYDGSSGFDNTDYNFYEYHNPKYLLANTAKDASYLLATEKEIIYLQNLARIDQKLFCATYVEFYIKDHSYSKDNFYISSLIEELNKDHTAQFLYPLEKLFKAAEYHAEDMGKKGTTGHTSSDGTEFGDRMDKFGFGGAAAENCSYGRVNPLQVVMQLLIDEGVSSLGHRVNMLNNDYSQVGVATRSHTKFNTNTVFDYIP